MTRTFSVGISLVAAFFSVGGCGGGGEESGTETDTGSETESDSEMGADGDTDADAGSDAGADAGPPDACDHFAVARDYIENEFCAGEVSNPELCAPYLDAYDGAANGVVWQIELRDFLLDAPAGSAEYTVCGAYAVVTFEKGGGTSLLVTVGEACDFQTMTYLAGGPGKYPWITADEARVSLDASWEGNEPSWAAPRLVWYPCPETGYSQFSPLWLFVASSEPSLERYVNQSGDVFETIAKPLSGR